MQKFSYTIIVVSNVEMATAALLLTAPFLLQ